MIKRFLSLVLVSALLFGAMYIPVSSDIIDIAEPFNTDTQTFKAIISPDGNIMTNPAVGFVSPGSIFTVEFYAQGFDSIVDITIPLLFDFDKARLVDNIAAINNEYFRLLENANYPLFDADNGYIQLVLQPNSNNSNIVDGVINLNPNDKFFLFSLQFRVSTNPNALNETFTIRPATSNDAHFDPSSPNGIIVLVSTPDDPRNETRPIVSTFEMNNITIRAEQILESRARIYTSYEQRITEHSQLSGGERIFATIENTDIHENMQLILAIYDNDGRFISAILGLNRTETIQLPTDISETVIKVFTWRNLNSMSFNFYPLIIGN